MRSHFKILPGLLLLTLLASGCDNDSSSSTDGNNGTPIDSGLPVDSLEDILAADVTDESLTLDLSAIQAELDSLAGGSRNSDPESVTEGDTATTLLMRAKSR